MGSRNPEVAVSRLEPAGIGGVLAAPDAAPKKLKKPRRMGSLNAGLTLVAVSDVDAITTPSGPRRAPVGGRLLAFRVADGVCEVTPCESWRTLNPQVIIDGASEDLPGAGDTFVVTLQPGPHEVDLIIDADGYLQSVSLLEDYVDGRNIHLLARPGQTERQPLNKTFRVAERTSVPLQYPDGRTADTFTREVTVEYYQRRFFLDGQTPSSPAKVFLIVNSYYSYVGQSPKYVVVNEATFVDKRGIEYPARDLDPRQDKALIGFEIPSDVTEGTFRLGGSTTKIAANGATYTSTLSDLEVEIDLS